MRCLIVGQDGTFGDALGARLRARGHVVTATTRRRHLATDDSMLFLDLAEPLPPLPKADVVIVCAAMARFEDCRRAPELARQVNVTAPAEIARVLTGRGTRLLYLSTSAVFDCSSPHRAEDDRVAPSSAYGRLKAEAERTLLALGPLVMVLRLTKVVRPGSGLLSDWIAAFGRNETVRAFDDHRFCPLPVDDVIAAITELVERGDSGIYHVSGADDVSYAEAARFLAAQVGAGRVEAVHGRDHLVQQELTPFTSLMTGRLSRLTGFVPPAPFEVLREVYGGEIDAARAALAHSEA